MRDAMLAAGERLVPRVMTDAEPARARRQAVGPRADLGATDRYVGKVLVIETGKRLSLQNHDAKDESIYVLSGRLLLTSRMTPASPATTSLGPGEARHVPTGRIHRYEALESAS